MKKYIKIVFFMSMINNIIPVSIALPCCSCTPDESGEIGPEVFECDMCGDDGFIR